MNTSWDKSFNTVFSSSSGISFEAVYMLSLLEIDQNQTYHVLFGSKSRGMCAQAQVDPESTFSLGKTEQMFAWPELPFSC